MQQSTQIFNKKEYSTGLFTSEYRFEETFDRVKSSINRSFNKFCSKIKGDKDIFISYMRSVSPFDLNKERDASSIKKCWEILNSVHNFLQILAEIGEKNEVIVVTFCSRYYEDKAKNDILTAKFLKILRVFLENYVFSSIFEEVGITLRIVPPHE